MQTKTDKLFVPLINPFSTHLYQSTALSPTPNPSGLDRIHRNGRVHFNIVYLSSVGGASQIVSWAAISNLFVCRMKTLTSHPNDFFPFLPIYPYGSFSGESTQWLDLNLDLCLRCHNFAAMHRGKLS